MQTALWSAILSAILVLIVTLAVHSHVASEPQPNLSRLDTTPTFLKREASKNLEDHHIRDAAFKTVLIPKLKRLLPPVSDDVVPEKQPWNSQVFQDAVVALLHNYKRNGYFVDLAANHPVKISNTYALEQLFDWKGICWEANSEYWYLLLNMRNCHVVGGAASSNGGEAIDFTFAGRLGGIPSSDQLKTDITAQRLRKAARKLKAESNGESVREVTVPTTRLVDVLHHLGAPRKIDYLSLDVEGAESLVLGSFDFSRYSFSVMTIERPKEDLEQALTSHGYRKHPDTLSRFGETLWLHKDFPNLDHILQTPLEDIISTARHACKSPVRPCFAMSLFS